MLSSPTKNSLLPDFSKIGSQLDTKEFLSELIRYYLIQSNIDTSLVKNKMVKNLLNQTNIEIRNQLNSSHADLSLKEIEEAIYSSLNAQTRKDYGVVYTPSIISDYIVEETLEGIRDNQTVVDFSCGPGEFLLASLKYVKKNIPGISLLKYVENNLYGVDILSDHVYWAKLIISLYLIINNEDHYEINFNIVQADSTNKDLIYIFGSKNLLSEGFDYIIGNPPYVKIQDLTPIMRKYLQQNYISCKSGSFNLFYAFIELSINHLSKNGKIGYVIPNHLLKMKSAFNLRKILLDNFLIDKVVDFKGNSLFPEAQTYSALLFLNKNSKDSIAYKNISYSKNPNIINKQLNKKFNTIQYSLISPDSINLLDNQDHNNIYKIENQSTKLRISTGIATQKDKLYLLDKSLETSIGNKSYYIKTYNEKDYFIEKELTLPIIKGSGQKKIAHKDFYEYNQIIYPYQRISNKTKAIPVSILKSKFPKTYEYFNAIKKDLLSRNSGSPSVKTWYEYGRSQSLECYVPKIIFPTNSLDPNFVYFPEKALFHNGYAIYGPVNPEVQINFHVLVKILNSVIMKYYIENTSYMISGGYYCFQKKYVQNFTIPTLTTDEHNFLYNTDSKEAIDSFLINKYDLEMNDPAKH